MRTIGFSTGALFRGDVAGSVDSTLRLNLQAIEVSALRYSELTALTLVAETDHRLRALLYVSFHAPTDFTGDQEEAVTASLQGVCTRMRWPVIVHPDCISTFALWRPFGSLLCIENMDKRKAVGRTVEELRPIFERLPEARLCFDIAHAKQVDSSMTEAFRIIREFRSRICQLHISEVGSASKHDKISDSAVKAFREVAGLLPDVPVIIESPVAPQDVDHEISQVARVFRGVPEAIAGTTAPIGAGEAH